MIKYFYFSCLALVLSFLFSCYNVTLEHEIEDTSKQIDKLIPCDWLYAQRAFPLGVNKEVQKDALRKVASMKKQAQRLREPWESLGPTNTGGRITDIVMHDTDMNTIYAGAASGGIFKSTDQGASWTPIFDDAASLAVGDLDIADDDPNILYVGTGEANGGGGSLTYDGFGIYKTNDAGATWTHLGLEDVGSIGKVEIDPNNSERVFVAAMGDIFGNTSDRGIYRTENGGADWEQVLFLSDSTGGIDVIVHPEDPNLVFAAMWERVRRPSGRDYAGLSSGVFLSKDGGSSWDKLDLGIPANIELSRIGLTISKSNPDILYAVVGSESLELEGIFKTIDRGESWTQVSTSGIDTPPFMYWFGKIIVDPTNPDVLYITSLDMFKSTNGGQSWFFISSNVHADQHAICPHPLNPQFVVAGNDGGVYISFNGGGFWLHQNTIPITQFYTCEVDFLTPTNYYGGTQDNGTNRVKSGDPADWNRVFGGDGFVVEVDPTNSNIHYLEYQRGNLFRTRNDGGNYVALGLAPNEDKNWNTPFVLDPNDPNTIFAGAERLYKSTQQGDFWEAISPRLSTETGTNLTYGTITTIDVSPLNSSIIYAGTDDGYVWVTEDGGSNWTEISEGLPKRWITKVHASPFEESVVYLSISGYRYHEYISHLFKSTDFGANWIPIANNLPEVPINDLLVNPNEDGQIYVATDFGVFVSFDDGQDWEILGADLPNVPVIDLDFHPIENYLLAATYGRGMFKLQIEDPMVSTQEISNDIIAKTYPNPFTQSLNIEWTMDKQEKVRISLHDTQGKLVASIHNAYSPKGKQSMQWNANALAKGMYVIRIESPRFEKSIMVQKL